MGEFGAFFWMRIGIIMFHIIIDLLQSICGGGKDTVGTLAHMSSLVAGFCYVILVLPPMGDGSLFNKAVPYIIPCAMTSPKYVSDEDATSECIAFFSRANGLEVRHAKWISISILGGGVLVSVINAIAKRHISDDGQACCACACCDDPNPAAKAAARPAAPPGAERSAALEQSTKMEEANKIRTGIDQMEL